MAELQRITTEFVDAEDRIRLAGEDAAGEAVVLWLTQRLLNRLVAHLCDWLEQRIPADIHHYAAAAQAGSESWKAFFFGASDAAGSITVDKPPLSLWPMALSIRM